MASNGLTESIKLGLVEVVYTSGKNAGKSVRVFDMSVGHISVENTGKAPVKLGYNAQITFFDGHHFAFGGVVEKGPPPPPNRSMEDQAVSVDLAPGQKTLIARQDFMDLLHREGLKGLGDGKICTSFKGMLMVDGKPHQLAFGPVCFKVELKRDWELEKKDYLKFFIERDKGMAKT